MKSFLIASILLFFFSALSLIQAQNLSADPSGLTFDIESTDSNPQSKSLEIKNTGSANLTWTADESSEWIVISSSSGSLDSAATETINVTVDPKGLQEDTYSDKITIAGGQDTVTVPITMIVPNFPPQAEDSQINIRDLTFQGDDSQLIDLSDLFSDGNADSLDYSISNNPDSHIATADITGDILELTLADGAQEVGSQASITVSASDGSESASIVFAIDVNHKPLVLNPIADQSLNIQPDSTVVLDIVDLIKAYHAFSDPNGDLLGYSVAVESEDIKKDKLQLIISPKTDKVKGIDTVKVSATDFRGGDASSSFLLITIRKNTPPDIIHQQIFTHTSDSALTINCDIIDDKKVDNAMIFYRWGGDPGFVNLPLRKETNSTSYKSTIPADDVTSSGVEYYLLAWDNESDSTRLPVSGYFSVQVIVRNGITDYSPFLFSENTYRLYSIPLDLYNKDPGDVLEDDLGSYDDTKWRFFEPLANGTFEEFPKTSPFESGKAFWLIVRSRAIDIDTGAGITVSTDTTNGFFSIDLQPGWTFFANPYHFDIPYDNLSLKSGLSPLDVRTYEAGWIELSSPSADIEPFHGYIIYSQNQDVLHINPDLSDESRMSKEAPVVCQSLWSLKILASCQQARDEDNRIEISSHTSRDLDVFDKPEPPVIGDYVSVFFPHPDWPGPITDFCADVRPEPFSGDIWEIQVNTNVRDIVHLTFTDLEQVPGQYEVWLFDENVNLSQNLRLTNRYSFAGPTSNFPKKLKIAIGPTDFINHSLTQTNSIPTAFVLDQNFPNPFNPATTIRYGLPHDSCVSLKIYNLLGKEIATLFDYEPIPAGYHIAIWDGRNKIGGKVSSGVYIVFMQAGDFTQSRKMLLIK